MAAGKCVARSPPHTRWHLRHVPLPAARPRGELLFLCFSRSKESPALITWYDAQQEFCVCSCRCPDCRQLLQRRSRYVDEPARGAKHRPHLCRPLSEHKSTLKDESRKWKENKKSCQQTVSATLASDMSCPYIFTPKNSAQVFIRAASEN